MKLKRGSKIAWFIMLTIMVTVLLVPIAVTYAETPVSVAVVAASSGADGLGSPFQHHSFIDNGTSWAFYHSGGMILSTWSDDGSTWVAGDIIAYYNGSDAETIGGQFDTWWDSSEDLVHFAVVNNSSNSSDIMYAGFVVDSVAHTLTMDGVDWVTAVEGVANTSYRNPTICVNNNDSVFITYGAVTDNVSDVYVMTTTDTAGDPWVPETNFPMFNLSSNASRPAMYGSVIPLWTDNNNVSVQYAGYNGSEYKIYQTEIGWDGSEWVNESPASGIDTSDWYLVSGQEWDYNAVSIDTVINDDDVMIQCLQTDGSDYRTFTNRRGNESDIWADTYARNFGAGAWDDNHVGAIGIRNNAYGIVYSGWNMEALSTDVESNDYDPVSGDWDGIATVYTDTNIPFSSTMSDYMYDIDATYDMGFLYGTTTDDNIMYGRYGPATPAPAAATDPGTTVMQIIIPLLIAIGVVILALRGIGEVNTVSAIIILMIATIIGIISFFVIKQMVLGI